MQDILGEVFAWLFVALVFFVVFVLPIWFVIRHSKKSKLRLKKAIKEQEAETPEQTRLRRNNHQVSIWGTLSFVAGLLFGSRILGSPLFGIILGLVLTTATRALIIRKQAKDNIVTFDTTLTSIGNGKVKTGPIPAKAFTDALEAKKDIRITTKESYRRISEINARKNKGKE